MKIFILYDGGFSDRSVQAVFTTREQTDKFLKRYEMGDIKDVEERELDAYDDDAWPPGRSWYVSVYPDGRGRTVAGRPCFWNCERNILKPEECTRAWRDRMEKNHLSEYERRWFTTCFWGTEDEVRAFAEAKLAETRR